MGGVNNLLKRKSSRRERRLTALTGWVVSDWSQIQRYECSSILVQAVAAFQLAES